MFRRKKVLGVVIGRDDIRAVEVIITAKNRYYISKYASSVPGDSILSEGVVVDEDAFVDDFVHLYRENGFTARNAVFGIDNQTTILRFASFPKVERSKQRNLIRLNAQEHIPTPISELELDYVTLGETEEEGGTLINVLLCAVSKKTIQRILDVSRAVSLTVQSITPSQILYANAMRNRTAENDFMAVRLGRKSVHHFVFEDREVAFMRHVNLSSETITMFNTLSRGESLLPVEIESLKKQLINNIDASINYYRLKSKREIYQIFISGASSVYRHISAGLDDELHSNVEYIRLYEPDGKTGASPPEEYDCCISLALDSVN